jgi:hypothetical protein
VLLAAVVYAAGFGFTAGATNKLGERNPGTKGDSFTGSSALDMWVCTLWPVTWVIWLPYQLGKRLFR